MWSPISPATGKSHDSLLRTKRGVKRSIYDFLGWKPEPSGLDIGSHYTSEPSYKHNPFSQDDDQVPTIRVVSPSGSNRRLQVSPPMMMSGASGGGVPAGSPPPRGPLPPRPRQPRQQFYPPRFNIPSMATTGSVGTESTIPDRSDVILPPFPAPPTTIPRHHYQPEPPHAVTTPSGYAPPDFGIFVHPYAHGHDPTRLSAISQITDMDFGRMSRSSLAESACSQQTDIEDDDDDCCESVWTDYNNDCRTDGTGTLERRARLDDLFLAVESEYRTSYAERYDEAGRPPLPPLPTNTVVRTRSGRNIATARSDESNGRRLC